jgi:Reverse transcriptase (RNA-dependent DNA polymerase).
MIAPLKKNQAKKCSDHRTISLISHTGNTVAHILSKRLENKIEEVIEEDQFRFLKGKGIIDAIGLMRIISERVLDVKEEMCLWFIDWQKAFNHVNWTKLLEMLRNIGVNWREHQFATYRWDKE